MLKPILITFISNLLFILLLPLPAAAVGNDSFEEHDAIIIEENTSCIISSSERARLYITYTVEILNDNGKKYGFVEIGESRFHKLKKFTASVLDANGREIYTLDKKDGYKTCGMANIIMYADYCRYRFRPAGAGFPYYAEYEYEIELKSLFFWRYWVPQKNIPVKSSTYTLTTPKDFAFRYIPYGDIQSPVVTKDGKRRIYRWELTDIPAFKDENYTPPNIEDYIAVQFTPRMYKLEEYEFDGTDWTTLSRDYYAMTKKRLEPDDSLMRFSKGLSHAGRHPRDIITDLHRQLYSKMRYIGIEIGIGNWLPTACHETFARGYGDCKDLSTLYVSVLRHLGIEAYTALALTRNEGTTNPDAPGLNNFNHMILFAVVEDDTIWVDPTCRFCRVGDLPESVENIYTLPGTIEGSGLIRTPASTANENMIFRTAEITLHPDRSITAAFTIRLIGNPMHWFHAQNKYRLFEDNLRRLSIHEYIGISEKIRIDSMSCDSIGNQTNEGEIRFFGRMTNAVIKAGDKQYMDISFLSAFRDRELSVQSGRTQSLDLEFPLTFADSLIITAPKGWSLQDLPPDTSLSEDFGTLTVTFSEESGRFIVRRRHQSYLYQVDRQKLPDYAEHLRRFSKAMPGHITFRIP
jgi:hypothetical protein